MDDGIYKDMSKVAESEALHARGRRSGCRFLRQAVLAVEASRKAIQTCVLYGVLWDAMGKWREAVFCQSGGEGRGCLPLRRVWRRTVRKDAGAVFMGKAEGTGSVVFLQQKSPFSSAIRGQGREIAASSCCPLRLA